MLQTDEELMLQTRRGSLPAFELLIRRWDKRMFGYFFRSVGDPEDAEDLRQELFLRVYQRRKTFRVDGRFRPWVYRIATNLFIDRHVRKKRPAMQSIDECNEECFRPDVTAPGSDSSRTASSNELRQRILKALKKIPDEKRAVIILSYFEHLSFREIGQTLKIPEHTVKNRFYRGLSVLRDELKSLGVFEADCFHET